jgi:hypothetical protein
MARGSRVDATAIEQPAHSVVTTASRRQRHRSHEARRLSDGRVDAVAATARRDAHAGPQPNSNCKATRLMMN